MEEPENAKAYTRNLSIIPEIESVVENSNFEEKERGHLYNKVKLKKEISENLYRLLKLLMVESDFEKAEYKKDYSKILPVYNKLRSSSQRNNYYAAKMFDIFVETGNYKSILVLIAETLDFLEQKGLKKIVKVPNWIQKHIFTIIEDKGLKFLNDLLEKLSFYDEAVLDAIQIAKKWKIKGVTY